MIWILIAVAFLSSFILQQYLSNKISIPIIGLYVILGSLLGVSVAKLYGNDFLNQIGFLSTITLSIVAFLIGIELSISLIKQLGKSILFIALGEVILSFLLVFLGSYYIAGYPSFTSLMLGAVASSTAPASTIFIIREYKASGPLTTSILSVTGVDDAFALLLYSFADIAAKNLMLSQGGDIHIFNIVLSPLIHITVSIFEGLMLAMIFIILSRKIVSRDLMLCLVLTIVMFGVGLAELTHASSLLLMMTLGMMIVNYKHSLAEKANKAISPISNLLLPVFFIFAGARLDFRMISYTLLLGIVYIITRTIGKYIGAFLGGWIGKASKKTYRWIGLALMPQVGVAFGLAEEVQNNYGIPLYGQNGVDMASAITNVLLWTTLIIEIAGPILTKIVLVKNKEIQSKK